MCALGCVHLFVFLGVYQGVGVLTFALCAFGWEMHTHVECEDLHSLYHGMLPCTHRVECEALHILDHWVLSCTLVSSVRPCVHCITGCCLASSSGEESLYLLLHSFSNTDFHFMRTLALK